MKTTILTFTLLALTATLRAQDVGRSPEQAIVRTVKAWQNKDEKTLNALVREDFGIAFLYRPGVAERLSIADSISFDNPVPEYLQYTTEISVDYTVRFEELPEYDCYDYEWNKPPGIYCDTVRIDTKLSTTAKRENEWENVGRPADVIERFEAIERTSHRIIVIGETGDAFVFHLTLIGDKWYLTVIDRNELCSA